jgi:flagellar biosynthesis/type III secretory pathway chaperone
MDNPANATVWETELGSLLAELSAVQADLLSMLTEKRQILLARDMPALKEMQVREADLIARLQACQDRRLELLARAETEGLPSQSLISLTSALPEDQRRQFEPQLRDASARIHLLQHHSLTNWVIIQKNLIHLSHLLEIIATGGRPKPTYGKNDCARSGGNLVDRAA